MWALCSCVRYFQWGLQVKRASACSQRANLFKTMLPHRLFSRRDRRLLHLCPMAPHCCLRFPPMTFARLRRSKAQRSPRCMLCAALVHTARCTPCGTPGVLAVPLGGTGVLSQKRGHGGGSPSRSLYGAHGRTGEPEVTPRALRGVLPKYSAGYSAGTRG